MKSTKGKTIDLSWAAEIAQAASVRRDVPEGWATVAQIAEELKMGDTQTRRLLYKVTDDSLVMRAKVGSHHAKVYHWARIKEIAGI